MFVSYLFKKAHQHVVDNNNNNNNNNAAGGRSTTPPSSSDAAPPSTPCKKRQSSSPVRRLIRAALAPIPAYESIEAQLFILSLIFFLGPGIYTALLGIGGGGLKDPTPVTHSFIVYSGTMAVFGFFAGPLVSKLGYRLSLLLGSGSYALYAASLAFVKWQQVRNGPDVGWILMPAASIQGMTNAVQ